MRLARLVKARRFDSEEPEFNRLAEWLRPGDVALDVGANFGSYTLRMSELVGPAGRVFSFEPVPQTFSLLVTSLSARGCKNVTALNVACSDESGPATMSIADEPVTGENLYRAHVTDAGPGLTTIYKFRVDDLPLPQAIRVIKIDAEGHDAAAIAGMWGTIQRCMPVLITEHPPQETINLLTTLGYIHSHGKGSPNAVFVPPEPRA